jgi:hypothetical protein
MFAKGDNLDDELALTDEAFNITSVVAGQHEDIAKESARRTVEYMIQVFNWNWFNTLASKLGCATKYEDKRRAANGLAPGYGYFVYRGKMVVCPKQQQVIQ